MARSKSSKKWLAEHFKDQYVKQAQHAGYRSRAVYKLLEIQQKDHIIHPGMTIIDLGAAPGGWSQAASECLHHSGHIFALDILPMDPLPHVTCIQGDFREDATLKQLLQAIGHQKADLVLSDMAPNISGIAVSDQARAMYLAELAFDLALQTLKPGGSLLVKVFQGAGFDDYLKTLRYHFQSVKTRKPKASRARSREVYLLAHHFN